jgi:tetratricopeptide (TPR) repeat protein
MPKRGKGEQSWQQVKQLVETLFDYELHERKDISHLDIYWKASTGADLKVKATMQALWHLLKDRDVFKPKNSTSDKQICNYIGEVLTIELRDFLEILEDHRDESERRGKSNWKFTLKLWSQEHKTENLENLKKLWNTKKQAAGITSNSGQAAGTKRDSRQATGTTRGTRVVGLQNIIDVPVWKGRDEILAELKAKLLHPQNPPKVLAIIGQGGIGKTSLAVKLIEAVGVNLSGLALAADSPYEGAMYFKVQERTTFDDVAEFLLSDGLRIQTPEPLKTADEKIAKIIEGLAQNRFLLVLDNLEDILHPAKHSQARKAISPDWGKLLNALVYNQHQSQTILTCREVPADLGDSRSKKATINRKLVQVEKLLGVDTEASVEILKEYGLRDSEEDLQWIAERVKGHVFVLDMLGNNYADEPGKLRKHPELVTDEVEVILTEQLARQSEAACDLLCRMCILRAQIDVRGLTFLRLYTDDWEQDNRLMTAAESNKAVEISDEDIRATEQIIEQLVNSSLVQTRYDEEKCESFYDLHPVTADFVRKQYNQRPELFKRVDKFYQSNITFNDIQDMKNLLMFVEPVIFALNLGDEREHLRLVNMFMNYSVRLGNGSLMENAMMQHPTIVEGNNQAEALLGLGLINYEIGNWDEAERCFKAALAIAQTDGNKSNIANAIGWLGSIERNRGNWDEAERLYRQYLEVMTELGDRSGMAYSWGVLGDIERNRGNWDEAERLYRQSLELMTELGDRSGMASCWGVLGDIERDRGNWDEAERLYRQSLELRTELGDRPGMASSWGVLGSIERKRGNWDEAERLYRQCLELRTELGDRSGMATCWGVLGDIERNRGNWAQAERLYRQCLEVETELGDRSGMAASIGCLGETELGRGNLDAAEPLLQEALVKMQELGMTWHIGETNTISPNLCYSSYSRSNIIPPRNRCNCFS